MRVVLDTNVLISALFWNGNERVLLDKCRTKELELILSPYILEELGRVLDTKFSLPKDRIADYSQNLILISKFVFPSKEIHAIKDDPTDNMILECAVAGNANIIVSGDKHLLNLGDYKTIRILNARDFLSEYD